MSHRILTKQGIDNTNIDGARDNHFNAGRRSGVVLGSLSGGNFFAAGANIVALGACELRLSGHRVVIDDTISVTLNNPPVTKTKYSFVAAISVSPTFEPSFSYKVQAASTALIQNNLFETGSGVYELEVGTFYLDSVNGITGVVKTCEDITGFGEMYNERITDIENELPNKVDKVTGKGLSTNDLTNELKQGYDTAVTQSHTHDNKSILDDITAPFTDEEKDKLAEAVNAVTVEQMIDIAKQDIDPKVDEIEGEFVYVPKTPDSNQMFDKLKIYGQSTQDGTPTPASPVAINNVPSSFDLTAQNKNFLPIMPTFENSGITYTSNGDGTYTANGTATGDADYTLSQSSVKKPVGTYILSGAQSGGSTTTWYIQAIISSTIGNPTRYANDTGSGAEFTINATEKLSIRMMVRSGNIVNNLTFKPMLRFVSTSPDFVAQQATTQTIQIKDNRDLGEDSLHELCSLPDGTANSIENGKIIKRVKKKVFTPEMVNKAWYFYSSWMGDNMCALYLQDTDEKSSVVKSHYYNLRNNFFKGGEASLYNSVLNIQSGSIQIAQYVKQTDLTDKGFTLDAQGAVDYLKWMISNSGQNIELLYPYSDLTMPEPFDLHPDELEKLKTLKSFSGGTCLTTHSADTTVKAILNLDYLKIDSDPNYVQFVDKSGKTLAPYTKGNMVGIGEAGGEVVYLTDDDGKIQQISPDGSVWVLSISNAGVASWAKKV